MIHLYTDGACQGNPGPGGWAAILVEGGRRQELKGRQEKTTNNRMEVLAAIEGLAHIPEGSEVTVHSDSEYLVKTMTKGWKRQANIDLWRRLDSLVASRRVRWEWIEGESEHPEHQRAHHLANEMAGMEEEKKEPTLTHLDARGQARMVDSGAKPDTERVAVAQGSVLMQPRTLHLILEGQVAKGDVLAVARVAGVMAAKRTPELIPLCHPLLLTQVTVDFRLDEEKSRIEITATARCTGKTGAEMEALTAVAASALTIYDMAKAVDRGMRIEDIRLRHKEGGKSGAIDLD